MIDVFIREHFTSDSNAMMVGFLREFADAEEAVGNITGATSLRAEANLMETAVNALLWATPGRGLGGDDHYITQVWKQLMRKISARVAGGGVADKSGAGAGTMCGVEVGDKMG